MNMNAVLAWMKKNWPLPLLLAGVAVTVAVGKWGPTLAEDDAAGANTATVNPAQRTLQKEFDRAARTQTELEEKGAGEARTTDDIIAEHTAALEGDLAPDQAAARLSALGNLYKQKKQDYATAARYFEELIQDYPEWPGIRGAYHQLMTCYTRLDDQPSLRLLYRKMVEVFPEESNEYQYAKDALGNP